MHIKEDDLSGPEIRALLESHFAGMLANSPKDSCHFLDFDGLKSDDVTFWSIWDAC
jgi:putative acetyltransferase